MATPVLMSWSSGKDSAFALHVAREDPRLAVVGLLTTVTADFDRVSMHGVRRVLLQAQARALGLPLRVVEIPQGCTHALYAEKMQAVVHAAVADGIRGMVFGDLFLEEVRAYRERNLQGTGLSAHFPLWGRPTAALARDMLDAGVTARIVCLDPRHVDPALAGTPWDAACIAALPSGVDPCGEHGEFHTFVTNAPGFAAPVAVTPGQVVERDGFVFADLLADGPEVGAQDGGGDEPSDGP